MFDRYNGYITSFFTNLTIKVNIQQVFLKSNVKYLNWSLNIYW